MKIVNSLFFFFFFINLSLFTFGQNANPFRGKIFFSKINATHVIVYNGSPTEINLAQNDFSILTISNNQTLFFSLNGSIASDTGVLFSAPVNFNGNEILLIQGAKNFEEIRQNTRETIVDFIRFGSSPPSDEIGFYQSVTFDTIGNNLWTQNSSIDLFKQDRIKSTYWGGGYILGNYQKNAYNFIATHVNQLYPSDYHSNIDVCRSSNYSTKTLEYSSSYILCDATEAYSCPTVSSNAKTVSFNNYYDLKKIDLEFFFGLDLYGYDSVYLSSAGYIIFWQDKGTPNFVDQETCDTVVAQNILAFSWQTFDLSSGKIKYEIQTENNSVFKQFVIIYENILLSDGSGSVTVTAVLREETGGLVVCTTNNSPQGIIALKGRGNQDYDRNATSIIANCSSNPSQKTFYFECINGNSPNIRRSFPIDLALDGIIFYILIFIFAVFICVVVSLCVICVWVIIYSSFANATTVKKPQLKVII